MQGGKRPGSGRPKHVPTKATRDTVSMHTMVGTPQNEIARVIGIDTKTLHKYYRDEIDLATCKANAQVGGALYNKAIKGDTTAIIFWLKTRAGFKEARHEPAEQSDSDKLTDVLANLIDKLPN